MLKLVLPNKECSEKVKPGIQEIKENPADFDTYAVKLFIAAIDEDRADYFDRLEKERLGIDLKPGIVPQTELWLMDEDKFIGLFTIKHFLTDDVMALGIGHIGYEIIPSERQKGYAKAGLRLLLNYAKNILGLDQVLITPNAQNIPSNKTVLALINERGGEEIDPVKTPKGIKRRYLVKT